MVKNEEIPVNFTKIENLFRKLWLITLILYPIYSTLSFFGGLGSIFYQNDVFHTKYLPIIVMLVILLFCWGLFYINYRCSYKKMGTKLLIFRLILSIPIFLGAFLLVIPQFHRVSIVASSIIFWLIFIDIVMLKINLKYKRIKQKTPISA